MKKRNFDEWLSKFRPSISSYDYYIDFEKVVRNMAEVLFIKPKQRPYMTNNYYALLERQDKLDKEVEAIVSKQKND